MSKHKWLWSIPVLFAVGLGLGFDRWLAASAVKADLKPATSLPLTRVVMFNSGVGYFSRSGEVDGDRLPPHEQWLYGGTADKCYYPYDMRCY